MKRWTCPNCGNTNRKLMMDNGEADSSPDLTVLCVNPLPASETVGGEEWWAENGDGEQPTCGEQWDPN